MAIKESVNELSVGVPKPRRTLSDYVALAIATCGVGYLPLAPGTWGSLVGVGIFLLLQGISARFLDPLALSRGLSFLAVQAPQLALILVAITVVTLAGIWAGTRAELLWQKEDPSKVVVDEVAGQMIALLSASFYIKGWWSIISAFVLFRVFDIWKPFPVRRLESLESGLGIMADDVAAGLYAAVVNSVLVAIYFLFVPGQG
jgi:phosphatidylglycerophosphatase A